MEMMKTWTAPSPEGEDITYEIYDEKARNDIATLKNDVANKEASGTAETKVSNHNTDTEAHNDIRLLLTELITQVNSFLDVDDTTRDQLSELLRDIDANKTSIESIISGKVNVTDIINNLTTNVANKPLSAAQGVVLKNLIDTLQTAVTSHTSNGNIHITAEERAAWNAKQPAGSYALQSEVNSLSEEKVDYNQGTANVGKMLIVGADGNLALSDIPENISDGDVIGTLDEDGNIIITGELTDGTYTFQYENTDGTYAEIGSLIVGTGGEEEGGYTNLLDTIGYEDGMRLSVSAGTTKAADGRVTIGYLQMNAGDTAYIKGMTFPESSDGTYSIAIYNIDTKVFISGTNLYKGLTWSGFTSTFEDDLLILKRKADVGNVWVRVTGGATTGADCIVTLNEEITD